MGNGHAFGPPHQVFDGVAKPASNQSAPPPLHVVRGPYVLLPNPGARTASMRRDQEQSPHYETVLEVLQQRGIKPDQMLQYEGVNPPSNMVRAHPYRVIAVPHLELEIAVTNQKNAGLFVVQPMLGRYAYTLTNEVQMYKRRNTQLISPNAEDQLAPPESSQLLVPASNPNWRRELHDSVRAAQLMYESSDPKPVRKSAAELAKSKPRISAHTLASWVVGHIIDHRRAPTEESGPIEGADEGQTWHALMADYRKKNQSNPNGLINVQQLMLQQCRQGLYDHAFERTGLSPYEVGLKRDFTESWIDGRINATILSTGKIPAPNDGQIIGADKGETWSNAQAAIHSKLRGFEESKATGLGDYIARRAATGAYDAALKRRNLSVFDIGIIKSEFSEEFLTEAAIADVRINSTFPNSKTGRIPNAAEGRTWNDADGAFRQKTLGLEDSTVDGLSSFIARQCRLGAFDRVLKEKDLSPYEAGIKRDFTEDWLDDRVIATIRETGQVPTPYGGQILGADRGEIWLNVDNAIRKKGRGMEQTVNRGLMSFINTRAHAGVYDEVLREKRMTFSDVGIIPIFETAQLNADINAHILKHGKVPTIKTARQWEQVDNALRRDTLDLEGPKADTLAHFIQLQAREGNYDSALKERGVSAYTAGIKRDFTPTWLDGRLIAHIDQHGTAPSAGSGQIIGADVGEVWRNPDNALRQKDRGFEQSGIDNLPDYMLARYNAGVFNEVLARKNLELAPNLKQRFRLIAAKPVAPQDRDLPRPAWTPIKYD